MTPAIEKALEEYRSMVANRVLCGGPPKCSRDHAPAENDARAALLAAIEEERAQLRAEGGCDACAAKGDDKGCMCGGTGRAADAVIYLRAEVDASEARAATAREEADALRGALVKAGVDIEWLKGVIATAAPLTWVATQNMDAAREWEVVAGATLLLTPEATTTPDPGCNDPGCGCHQALNPTPKEAT